MPCPRAVPRWTFSANRGNSKPLVELDRCLRQPRTYRYDFAPLPAYSQCPLSETDGLRQSSSPRQGSLSISLHSKPMTYKTQVVRTNFHHFGREPHLRDGVSRLICPYAPHPPSLQCTDDTPVVTLFLGTDMAQPATHAAGMMMNSMGMNGMGMNGMGMIPYGAPTVVPSVVPTVSPMFPGSVASYAPSMYSADDDYYHSPHGGYAGSYYPGHRRSQSYSVSIHHSVVHYWG
jgi:hypothetical protein